MWTGKNIIIVLSSTLEFRVLSPGLRKMNVEGVLADTLSRILVES